jgi:hypothetical protein
METVPDYLSHLVTLASMAKREQQEGVPPQLGIILEMSIGLRAWADDDDFWASTRREFDPLSVLRVDPDQFAEAEAEILTIALSGDEQLARVIVINMSLRYPSGTPDDARGLVTQASGEGRRIAESPPEPIRKWSGWRYARRVFRGATGGLAIAANIVTPDPTLLTKVASIAGGVELIISGISG